MDYEVYVGSSCQNKDLEKGIITIGDKRWKKNT
jgi:hypothetical protein